MEEGEEAAKMAEQQSAGERAAAGLATRHAVNLLQVLEQIRFYENINHENWWKKECALDDLLKAGGERPYKLCQLSGSINCGQLIRKLEQLLSHIHYLVCSKALTALGMLAEGVGAILLLDMRPLLPTLVSLFKNKNKDVIKAVASCLDKLFANVFSFKDLLDSNNSLRYSLDEKKQKDALVMKNVLTFFPRCVRANGTYGKRGKLTIKCAEDLKILRTRN